MTRIDHNELIIKACNGTLSELERVLFDIGHPENYFDAVKEVKKLAGQFEATESIVLKKKNFPIVTFNTKG